MKWFAGLTVAMLLLILLVGLKPGDISPQNRVTWLPDRTGLRFETYGIAYTDSISDLIETHIAPENAFSIQIACKAKEYQADGFHFLFLLHGGQDDQQLLIGQWRSSLIVMNGDDYAHRKKIARITATPPEEARGTQFVTVTTGDEGTRIYLNGQLAAQKTGLRLAVPGSDPTRLIIGNSVYGSAPWEGDIYGVAVFGRALSEDEVAGHYDGWSKASNFLFLKDHAPILLYNLDGNGSNLAPGGTGTAHALQVPARMKILSPALFFLKLDNQRIRNLAGDRDAHLNLFGFVPLGFLLGATLIRLGGNFRRHCISIATLSGFLVSLWIETLQAWMPARSSDLQDLVLNTAGTLAGALLGWYLLARKKKHEERKVGR